MVRDKSLITVVIRTMSGSERFSIPQGVFPLFDMVTEMARQALFGKHIQSHFL